MPIAPAHMHQAGFSLIAAIVLLLALTLMGAMIATLTSTQSENTIDEWYSAQALYAAESGIQVSAYKINHGAGNCNAADAAAAVQLEAGLAAWYTIQSTAVSISGINVCRITAIGMAGGTSGSPVASRQIVVDYKSIVVP
jgi:hypothetical protein